MPREKVASRFDGRRPGGVVVALAALIAAVPGAAVGAAAGCAAKLTDTELVAISPGAEFMQALEPNPGHSECSWSVRGTGEANTLSVTFWEPRAMADAIVPADSPEEFFETYVQSAESVRGTQREALKGVGQRSALFREGGVRELYVLTKGGVAHLVTDALTDAQVTDVARAVAAP